MFVFAEDGSSSTMSGGSGGFTYDVYGFCSPPIMSNTDPLFLATLSPPVSAPPSLQSVTSLEPAGAQAPPVMPPSPPHTSLPMEESQASPVGSMSPIHTIDPAFSWPHMPSDYSWRVALLPSSHPDVSGCEWFTGRLPCHPSPSAWAKFIQRATICVFHICNTGPPTAACGAAPAFCQCDKSVLATPKPSTIPAQCRDRWVRCRRKAWAWGLCGQHHKNLGWKVKKLALSGVCSYVSIGQHCRDSRLWDGVHPVTSRPWQCRRGLWKQHPRAYGWRPLPGRRAACKSVYDCNWLNFFFSS